jgi:electron transport complex protein RnfB
LFWRSPTPSSRCSRTHVSTSGCTVGGEETAQEIADYLGVDAGEAVKRVARLLCAGGTDVAIQMSEYHGHESCRSAAAVGGGSKGCRFGCLGFGDCFDVCDFDAIRMSDTKLPVVDVDKCTACGDCVDVCPKDLFELMPIERKLLVQCKSELEGDEILELCQVACTACSRCVADAPQGLLKMKKNLPVLNPELTHLQSSEATIRCPSGAIVWVDGAQFQPGESLPAERTASLDVH